MNYCTRCLFIFACLSVAALLLPRNAHAQQSRLDDASFVDELTRRGMSDMLLHLAPRIKDPLVSERITIGQLRNQFLEAAEQYGAMLSDEHKKLLADALTRQRRLIENNRNHLQRPLWQADLVEDEFQLNMTIVGMYADLFYEFGVPTSQQRELFETSASDLYTQMVQAVLALEELERELLRNDQRRQELEFSGLLERIMTDYKSRKVPYYLALAANATALLSDTHPYFQSLGKHDFRQASSPAEERKRLLNNEVIRNLSTTFVNDANTSEAIRLLATLQVGRAELMNGQYDAAIRSFDKVLESGNSDMQSLIARLGKARAQHGKKSSTAAVQGLDALRSHDLVAADMVLQLLVADTRHRIMLEAAQTVPASRRSAAIDEAYDVYFQFLNRLREAPEHDEGQIAGIENYIFMRWENNVVEGEELPAAVVMGMGTAARGLGSQLMLEAEQAMQSGDEATATRKVQQATPHLEKAIRLLSPLVQRDNVSASLRARTMFNLALAVYLGNQQDPDNVLRAASLLIDQAEQLPAEPESERAIELATQMLQPFYYFLPRPSGIGPAYERALKVLFTHYPSARYADEVRLSYAMEILIPGARLKEAQEILQSIPRSHVTYYEAMREWLYVTFDRYRAELDAQVKTQLLEELVEESARIEKEGMAESSRLSPEQLSATFTAMDEGQPVDDPAILRATLAFDAAGHARLMQAEAASQQGQHDQAKQLVSDVEQRFAVSETLLLAGLGKRIDILVASGDVQDAGAQAQLMLANHPDYAVDVVSDVINRLGDQIDELRARAIKTQIVAEQTEYRERARTLASVAANLSDLLSKEAIRKNWPAGQLLYLQLMESKTRRLSESFQAAYDLAKTIQEKNPDDLMVITNTIEAGYALALSQSSKEQAQPLLYELAGNADRIINYFQNNVEEEGGYQPEFWNAWMRRMQAMDHLGEYTEDIPLRVANLQRVDPNLGGEPYKSEMIRLRNKYQ